MRAKEPQRTAKKNHLGKSSMDKHVSPNKHQVLADVAGNNNNDHVTMDKETMNEQEIDRLNKKLMARLINTKFLTFKKN